MVLCGTLWHTGTLWYTVESRGRIGSYCRYFRFSGFLGIPVEKVLEELPGIDPCIAVAQVTLVIQTVRQQDVLLVLYVTGSANEYLLLKINKKLSLDARTVTSPEE